MTNLTTVLLRGSITAGLALTLNMATARAQQSHSDASMATLDRLIAAGKSRREVAQYLFDTRGCNGCHTIAGSGKLGLTKKGQERAKGFEGCVATLKAMTVIAKVPESRRSDTQRLRVQRFEEFGCSTCHRVAQDQVGLTDVGAKLANLHLGCVDVEKVLAGVPSSRP